jgi:hypothetical protein
MSNSKCYLIKNLTDPLLFWSNEDGWVDYYYADSFTEEETKELNLPFDGEWVCWLALNYTKYY